MVSDCLEGDLRASFDVMYLSCHGMEEQKGDLLHVDRFAHNKNGTAYRDRSQTARDRCWSQRGPHQQPRLLPSCTK
jgi:hypothetical protein